MSKLVEKSMEAWIELFATIRPKCAGNGNAIAETNQAYRALLKEMENTDEA